MHTTRAPQQEPAPAAHAPLTTARQRLSITIACMLSTSLAALDSTIVGTAMPTVIGDLGGLALYPWVFSAYLLASTTTVPIYGKLADLFGRKPVLLVGIGLFLAGSALCGASQSMVQLIAFRAVQGLGAGAVLPITTTIVADIYTPERRARIQGWFSGVWGVSSVVGPALGGLIVQFASWHWVFYVNVPIGLVAVAILVVALHEQVARRKRSIDYAGAVLMSAAVTSLLLALLQGGQSLPWKSFPIIGLFVLSMVFLLAFAWQELHVPEPMLPFSLFRQRIIAVSSLAGVLSGTVMFGLTSYVPLFVQGVQGLSPTSAGAALAPMSFGWPVGSIVGGRLILRLGYRVSAISGLVFITLGAGLVRLLLVAGSPTVIIGLFMAIIGLGLGFSSLAFLLAVQNAVPWSSRGTATASVQFFRTIGGAVGVAVMGAVLTNSMAPALAAAGIGFSGPARRSPPTGANVLLDHAARLRLPPETLALLIGSLDLALHRVFLFLLVTAALGLGVALFFPKGKIQQHGYQTKPESPVSVRPSVSGERA